MKCSLQIDMNNGEFDITSSPPVYIGVTVSTADDSSWAISLSSAISTIYYYLFHFVSFRFPFWFRVL